MLPARRAGHRILTAGALKGRLGSVSMRQTQAARQILDVCQQIHARGYVAASDGNVSIRLSKNRILSTPTGMSKGQLKMSDLVVCDLDGGKISGRRSPTSEIIMHCYAYKRRRDVHAVVHAHPPYATGFAVAGMPLDKFVLPEVVVFLGQVPLLEYTTPGTAEICGPLGKYIRRFDAFLMQNHGVLTIGADVFQAYSKMEIVELFAKTSFVAQQVGRVGELNEIQLKSLRQLKKSLGLHTGEPLC